MCLCLVAALFGAAFGVYGDDSLNEDFAAEHDRIDAWIEAFDRGEEPDPEDLGEVWGALEELVVLSEEEDGGIAIDLFGKLLKDIGRITRMPLDPEEARNGAQDILELLVAEAVRQAKTGDQWIGIGAQLHQHGYLKAFLDAWSGRDEEIFEEKRPAHIIYRFYFLASAHRALGDWEEAEKCLRFMEDTTAQVEETGQDSLAYCKFFTLSERMRLLMDQGKPRAADELSAEFRLHAKGLPAERHVEVDVLMRLNRTLGRSRSVIDVIETYLAEDGEKRGMVARKRCYLAVSRVMSALYEGRSVERPAAELRAFLEKGGIDAEERFDAAYELFGAMAVLGDLEGMEFALDDVRETYNRLVERRGESALEEMALVESLRGIYLLQSEASSERLDAQRLVIRECIQGILTENRSRPIDEASSSINFFPRENFIIGACFELESRIRGEEGVIDLIDTWTEFGVLTALCQRLGAQPVSLNQVRQDWLGEDHGLLLLIPSTRHTGGDRLVAIDRESIAWDTKDTEAPAITNMATMLAELEFAKGLSDMGSLEIYSEHLLSPKVRERVRGWKRITAVGVDGEEWMPLDLLLLDGVPVGVSKAVDHVPSLALLGRLRERARSPVSDSMMFVSPRLSPKAPEEYLELGAIDLGPEKRAALEKAFSRGSLMSIVGSNASLNQLAAIEESFDLLHVLAHGFTEPGAPWTGFLLAGEGEGEIVYPNEIERLPSSRVALLSVCRAGSGYQRRLESGLDNFGGRFIEHGADTVIMAHDRVPTQATIEFMRQVTEGITAGHSPAEAARLARAEMWERGGGSFEVAFKMRVWGLGHEPLYEKEESGFDYRIPLSVIVVAVLGLVFWRRKKAA